MIRPPKPTALLGMSFCLAFAASSAAAKAAKALPPHPGFEALLRDAIAHAPDDFEDLESGGQNCEIQASTSTATAYYCRIERLTTKDFKARLRNDFSELSERIRHELTKDWIITVQEDEDPADNFMYREFQALHRTTDITVTLNAWFAHDPYGDVSLTVAGPPADDARRSAKSIPPNPGFQAFVQNLLKEAPADFAALRGASFTGPRDQPYYRATMTDVGLRDCFIEPAGPKAPASYHCLFEQMNGPEAKAAFLARSRDIRKLLRKGWIFTAEKSEHDESSLDDSVPYYGASLTARQASTGFEVKLRVAIDAASASLSLDVAGAPPAEAAKGR